MAIKKTAQPKSRETQQAARAKQAKPLSYAEARLFHGGSESGTPTG